MRSKKNQFLKYKMSYQETTKPAVSSNPYSSSSVQDMVQVNTTTTSHLINKLNTFTTPYLLNALSYYKFYRIHLKHQ